MGRNGSSYAGSPGGLADYPQDGNRLEAAATFTRAEYRIGLGGIAAQGRQKRGYRRGQLNGAGLSALAEDGDLGAIAIRLYVAPA